MALHSTNKIFELIKADIDANFDPGYPVHVKNMFGISKEDWNKFYFQSNTILIFDDNEEYDRESNERMSGVMSIVFFVIIQFVGKAKTKYDYLQDKFRDYLTEDGYGKKWTSIRTQYPNERFEPFYPASKELVEILKGGLARYEIAGHMDFVVYKHV